jgi:hypothetical protein
LRVSSAGRPQMPGKNQCLSFASAKRCSAENETYALAAQ